MKFVAGFVVLNNLESLVADSPLAAGALTLNVSAGTGANFPSTFPFALTLWDEVTYPDPTDDTNMEIVYCTGRTTDALTISRGDEGTGDVEHANGSRVAMLTTAGMFNAATYGIQTQIDALSLSSYFDRTGIVITTATVGDTLNMLDDQVFALGTSEDAKFLWESADANANCAMIVLPEGDATNVPVLVIGDASILGQDLGFFDGVTQPLVSVVDDDKDSHIDFGFIGDDVGVIRIAGSSPELRGYIGSDILFHTTGVFPGNTYYGIKSGNLTAFDATVYNTCFGYNTGVSFTTAQLNTLIGYDAGKGITDSEGNSCVGAVTGISITIGNYNTLLGSGAGNSLVDVDRCVMLGHSAGGYETVGLKLFIDSLDRTDEATGRIQSLIYGVINADPALQALHINAKVQAHGVIPLTKTDSYTIALDDFGKSVRMNSGSAKIFTFPSVGANDDGARLTISKIGAGQVTLQMVDSDIIHDSSATGTLLNAQAGEVYATVTVEYCHATVTWNLISSIGTWSTT